MPPFPNHVLCVKVANRPVPSISLRRLPVGRPRRFRQCLPSASPYQTTAASQQPPLNTGLAGRFPPSSRPSSPHALTTVQPYCASPFLRNQRAETPLTVPFNQHITAAVISRKYHVHSLCATNLAPSFVLPRTLGRSRSVETRYCARATMATVTDRATTPPCNPAREDLEAREQLREIFLKSVHAGMPKQMLERVLNFDPTSSTLTVEGRTYNIQRNVFVVGFGKAVLGMARVVEDVLGPHIIKGILSIPKGSRADLAKAGLRSGYDLAKEFGWRDREGLIEMLLVDGSKLSVQEGAENNLPDVNAYRAARDIHRLVSNLTEKDIVIVLMSGGGSALLPYPVEPLTMDDVLEVTRVLFHHGADILQVNTVRKHLELLKGGGLAKAAMPAQVISFIISDVIGDSLDMIASGPTVRQAYSPHRCLEVIDRLGARGAVPEKVLQILETRKSQVAAQAALRTDPMAPSKRGPIDWAVWRHVIAPAPVPGGLPGVSAAEKVDWDRVQNVLVGTNAIACEAAVSHAEHLGFETTIWSTELTGEARQVGELFGKLAQYISACFSPQRPLASNPDLVKLEMELAGLGISKAKLNEIGLKVRKAANHSRPLCVVAGGETVVTLKGSGKGGRNQEMALAAGMQLQECFPNKDRVPRAHVFFLSAGTDGQDGPTDAAGAVADENFMADARAQGLDPRAFLENNDSYNLWSQFSEGRDLVMTGFTGTNVMDIQLLLVKAKPQSVSGR
ncbi:hypothetical protein BaRGS_00025125 [Batillaria attramentaria]|uniref:Glycerate kinase n=1 Tax=Batillaria attramentaria TaxID=370345 RepID=A0ABD0K9G7_9CAEN